jgi:hypothetical protein
MIRRNGLLLLVIGVFIALMLGCAGCSQPTVGDNINQQPQSEYAQTWNQQQALQQQQVQQEAKTYAPYANLGPTPVTP